jgi:hypothetical protein
VVFGPLVFLDYLRDYGEDRIGGLQFVGAITKLGSPSMPHAQVQLMAGAG